MEKARVFVLLASLGMSLLTTPPVFAQAAPLYQLGVIPPELSPVIPPGDDVILYIHGGPTSRLEEASDLVNPLLAEGIKIGKRFTLIVFDQPGQGYSSMVYPEAIVPSHDGIGDYYPLVAFSEEFIVALVNGLHIEDRNIYVIGGSLGGLLALRMGSRGDLPWLKGVVAWNPAGVWETYSHDLLKGIALDQGFGSANPKSGDNSARKDYFDGAFGPYTALNNIASKAVGAFVSVQANPEEWYRGDRDQYPSNATTNQPYRQRWDCKMDYIAAARLEQQEIYNDRMRAWHYRLGTEELIFSFFNDNWEGPANTADPKSNTANYLSIVKPTLLIAGDDDDWNEGYVPKEKVAEFAAALGAVLGAEGGGPFGLVTGLLGGAIGGVIGVVEGPLYFPWEDRWTRTRVMAPLMVNTPLKALWLENTGHSVHNERPRLLANQIVAFISGNPPPSLGAQIVAWLGQGHSLLDFGAQFLSLSRESSMPTEQPCQRQLQDDATHKSQYASVTGDPLAVPNSVMLLKQEANLGGKFSDDAGSSPGTYSTRLSQPYRDMASYNDPIYDLAKAAMSFYNGDTTAGNAFADLAVTGRCAYRYFSGHPFDTTTDDCLLLLGLGESPLKHPPAEDDVLKFLTDYYPGGLPDPVDETKLTNSVDQALERAYKVAWALRNPLPDVSYQFRSQLGWIAVSGEDDPPARPVNTPSGLPVLGANGAQVSAYPQYELQVVMCRNDQKPYVPTECAAEDDGAVPFRVRYTVAGLPHISDLSSPFVPPSTASTITLTGENFVGIQSVLSATTFDFNVISPNRIDITTPSNIEAGVYPIQVSTGGGFSSQQVDLTVVPLITDINPWNGPITGGTQIQITGKGFSSATQFKFGDATVTGQCTPTNCTVVSPSAANPGPVSINAVANGATSPASPASVFRYTQYPALTKLVLRNVGTDLCTGTSGEVYLNGNAPPEGSVVSLFSSSQSLVGVPSNITIAPGRGASGVGFEITLTPTPAAQTVWIIAQYQGSELAIPADLPAWPAISLCTDNDSLRVGGRTSGTVTLNTPAPAGGAYITLRSTPADKAAVVAIPPSVTVPANSYSAGFVVQSTFHPPRSADFETSVTISATYNAETASADITIWSSSTGGGGPCPKNNPNCKQ